MKKNYLTCLTACELKTVVGGTDCFGLVAIEAIVVWKKPYKVLTMSACKLTACAPIEGNSEYMWGNEIHDCNDVTIQKLKKTIKLDQPTPLGSRFASARSNWQ